MRQPGLPGQWGRLMPNLEVSGTVKTAKEKIVHVSDTGGADCTYEITFELHLDRRDYLRLALSALRKDELLLNIDVAAFQMSLDDMWDKGPSEEVS